MKLPYGVSDFEKLITEDHYYCDRTGRIPLLEAAGYYLLFIRPRRFGKSLLLSTLANYYDIAKKERFEALFGKLEGRKTSDAAGERIFHYAVGFFMRRSGRLGPGYPQSIAWPYQLADSGFSELLQSHASPGSRSKVG